MWQLYTPCCRQLTHDTESFRVNGIRNQGCPQRVTCPRRLPKLSPLSSVGFLSAMAGREKVCSKGAIVISWKGQRSPERSRQDLEGAVVVLLKCELITLCLPFWLSDVPPAASTAEVTKVQGKHSEDERGCAALTRTGNSHWKTCAQRSCWIEGLPGWVSPCVQLQCHSHGLSPYSAGRGCE